MGTKPYEATLVAMIDEATRECYGEEEQLSGLFCMLEEHLEMPFKTQLLDTPVTISGLRQDDFGRIVVECKTAKSSLTLPILDVPLPTPPPSGSVWIDAYRAWMKSR